MLEINIIIISCLPEIIMEVTVGMIVIKFNMKSRVVRNNAFPFSNNICAENVTREFSCFNKR